MSEEFGTAALDLSDASVSIQDVTRTLVNAKNYLDEEFNERLKKDYNDAMESIDTRLVTDYYSSAFVGETLSDWFDVEYDTLTGSFAPGNGSDDD